MRTFAIFSVIAALTGGGIAPALAQDNPNATLASFGATAPTNPVGRWVTAKRDAVVQISPCGVDLCGKIVGLVYGANDPAPRDWVGHPQCGMTIFRTAPTTDGSGAAVWSGSILDPRDGSLYNARIKVSGPDELALRGYIGLPLFGETQTWQAYDGPTTPNCRLDSAGNQ